MSKLHNEDILKDSFNDLVDDLVELAYVCDSTLSQISKALAQFQKKRQYLSPLEYEECTKQLTILQEEYELIKKRTVVLQEKSRKKSSRSYLQELMVERELLSTFYRLQIGKVAAAITATDWQSPSFLHSLISKAGRQTGEIKGTLNDYKRDQHLDGKIYEDKFVKEYVNGFMKFALHSYATNSGMGACTAILTFLQKEMKGERPILLGKNAYFENKELIKIFFKDRVKEVDETDTMEFINAISEYNPSAIFLDSLCNNPEVTVPNTKTILSFVAKFAKMETYFILDNTGQSIFCQPLSFALSKNLHLRLIVFESLNKYHQFGTDRVTGGIMWGYGANVGKLYEARDHSGTNISDVSVLSLPLPNKKILTKRLLRHSRNAAQIVTVLNEHLEVVKDSPLEKIYYPSLLSHPSYEWMKDQAFYGSYFTFGFKKKYQKVAFYQAFVKKAIAMAKNRKVQLVSGTSFGLNTSRIYLTALRADTTVPFVRFAVGTENRYEVTMLSEVLKDTIDSF